MNEKEFELGDSGKLLFRKAQLDEFLERMFDDEDRPWFVSDEACLYDIYLGDDTEMSERCEQWYGRTLKQADFGIPVWQLLDALYPTKKLPPPA